MKLNWKKNKVFFLIAAAVLISGYIIMFSSYLEENPFQNQKELVSPVEVSVSENNFYYITEASAQIVVTDKKNILQYTIQGDDAENTFAYAESVCSDDNGNIYIHDKIYEDDGVSILSERILKFNSYGQRTEILFESNNEEVKTAVFDLKMINGNLCFLTYDEEEISVYVQKDNAFEKIDTIPYSVNSIYVTDIAYYQDGSKACIAVVFKNGNVSIYKNGEEVHTYLASNYDTEDFFSIITEVVYVENGDLYLCDTGLRQIYRMDKESFSLETVVTSDDFVAADSEKFSKKPLYTGLNVSNGVISFLTTEFTYDKAWDEVLYFYGIAAVSEDGEILFHTDSVELNMTIKLLIFSLYFAGFVLIVIFLYGIARIVSLLKNTSIDTSVKIQCIVVLVALLVAIGSSTFIFKNVNERFIEKTSATLCNIGYWLGEKIDEDIILSLNTPDAFFSKEYAELDVTVNEVLKSDVNEADNIYCVIYKVKNDVVCELYREDMLHAAMYPMAGQFENSTEEYIAQNHTYEIFYDIALSEGTYIYALLPMYSDAGENIAFIEVGMDFSYFTEQNNSLYTKVLMLTIMAVIIVILLFSEILCAMEAIKAKRMLAASKKQQVVSPEMIRPLSFLFFSIANISTAFLPIYGLELWDEFMIFPAEIAAAFPLSAEMICAAVSAFACGFIVKRTGVKLLCMSGAGFYLFGNILSAYAGNLQILIFANALCGIGSGALSLAINTWAASYEEESLQNKGFIHINAAYLAGLNCGTVIGSIICDNFGIKATYFAGAAGSVVLMLLAFIMIGKVNVEDDVDEEEDGSLKDLVSPAVIRYFLFLIVPYLICTGFLEYFFPIVAEGEGLSATHISLAFLLSGLISIYMGSLLTEPLTQKMGTKKTMILASFIYVAALTYLVINPSIISCYIVVVLFAFADSFGLSAQAVYFSSMPDVKKAGQSKALGVNSTVESITTAGGTLVFGAALTMGTRRGVFVILLVFAVCLVLFVFAERKKSN